MTSDWNTSNLNRISLGRANAEWDAIRQELDSLRESTVSSARSLQDDETPRRVTFTFWAKPALVYDAYGRVYTPPSVVRPSIIDAVKLFFCYNGDAPFLNFRAGRR